VSVRAQLRDPEVAHRRRWLTLGVLCVSLFVIVLDNTILNVAIPTLARAKAEHGLGATASQLQWIVDSYTLVFAGLLLTAGSLGDRFGRYRALSFGLAVFGTGSALSAFAGSAGMLIATRCLMGIGGAFIMPSTLSILTNVFTDPQERGKAIGIWAGCAGLAGLGPVIGGGLLTHFWWGSVFIVNVPVVIGGLLLGAVFVPDSRDPSAPKLDPFGALLSIVSLGTLLWAVIEGPAHGWGSGSIMTAFAVGGLLLVGFFVWELRCESPMLDMHFFENPRFSAASGAVMLTFFALFGAIFLVTQYFQLVLGYSAVKAGAVLLPQAVGMMIFAPLSHIFVKRFGNKVVVAGGLFVVGLCLLLFHELDASSGIVEVMFVAALLSIGMGNVMAPATDSIMGSLPRAKAGVGSAMNDTTRQVGGAIGVAVLGSILASHFTSSMTEKLHGVPSGLVAQARSGIGSALAVAQNDRAAAPYAKQIVEAAKTSFIGGMHVAVTVAAVVILIAAAGVLKWLPARATDEMVFPPAEDRDDAVADHDVIAVASD
jgi:EmrB/QacA subfamily drug resistance transporter